MKSKYQILRGICVDVEKDIIQLEERLNEIMEELAPKYKYLRQMLKDCEDDFNKFTFQTEIGWEMEIKEDHPVIQRILIEEGIEFK